MRKRQHDTDIWDKPWFRKLGAPEKLAFLFILDKCDPIGVWDADLDAAEFFIGGRVKWKELYDECNGNLEVFEGTKIMVKDFCRFQYGKLNPKSDVHRRWLEVMERRGLKDRFQALIINPLATPLQLPSIPLETPHQPREEEEEEEAEESSLSLSSGVREDNSEDIGEEPRTEKKEQMDEGVTLKPSEHEKLVDGYGLVNTKRAYKKLSAYKLQTGKRYKSDYGAILSWVMREVQGKGAVPEPRGAGEDRGPTCDWCGMTGGKHTGGCDRPGNPNGLPEREFT